MTCSLLLARLVSETHLFIESVFLFEIETPTRLVGGLEWIAVFTLNPKEVLLYKVFAQKRFEKKQLYLVEIASSKR